MGLCAWEDGWIPNWCDINWTFWCIATWETQWSSMNHEYHLGCYWIILTYCIPYHPCMVYLPTFTKKKTQPNVGKYTLHGWYGYDQFDRNLYFFVYFDAAKTKRSPSKKPLSGDDNLARTATVQVGWDGVGGNLAMRLCWLEQIRMGTDSCLIVLPCFTMFCWFYHGLSMSYPYHPQ